MERTIAKVVVNQFRSLFSSLASFSGIEISADHWRVFIPIFIDSNKDTIPLNIGIFQKDEFSASETNSWRSILMSLSGSRTAVEYAPGTRIITPSMTA